MPKRGFSLVELLIALGVIVALGAVVAADLFGWAAQTRFDEAGRRVGSAFVMARADAQREGRALAVVARLSRSRNACELFVEEFDPEATGDTGDSAAGPAPAGRAGRRLMVLPAGVRVSERAPGSEAAGATPLEAESPEVESIRLCVMLPDGGAWDAEPFYLVGARERAARVRVNRWTGAAQVEMVEPGQGTQEEEKPELPPGAETGKDKQRGDGE